MTSPRLQIHLGGSPLPAAVLARLTRLEVREGDDDPSVVALRFGLVQRGTGEYAPLDDDLVEPGRSLSVELEPPGGTLRRVFEGVVTHLRPHFEAPATNSYLEILGMDHAAILDAHEKVAAWESGTDSDVIADILGQYRIRADTAPTPVAHDKDRAHLVQRGTDWRFAQHLARRNGLRFWFEWDDVAGEVVGRLQPPDVAGEAQADVAILQDGECLSWADVQLLATGPVGVTGAAIDPVAKRVIRASGEPVLDVMGGVDAAQGVADGLQAAGATGTTALLRHPPDTDEALAAAASGATDAARFVLELRAELDPALYRGLLRARRPVLVRGIGRRFSGTYHVRSVRTTLDGGVLSQTFTAVRNATDQTGGEPFGQSAEEVPAS
ncbi:MAG: contractile injection system protein, VgrG/Pvc8 family [Kineosporiaceae bacterium]